MKKVVLSKNEAKKKTSSVANWNNYKIYLLMLTVYLVIALILFWPVTLNITNTIPAGGPGISVAGTGDVYQNLWNLWWVNYAIFDLHTSPYFTNLLFYPVGANLVTQTLSPLAGLFSLAFQGISLAFSYNAVFFTGFALSGFFTFLLADYLLKNKYAAFISGIVFAFSPFHMIHALFGHLNWASIEFLPLFLLFFLIMIKDKKTFAVFGTAISFALLFFFGDPEQGIIGFLMALMLLFAYAMTAVGREEIFNKKSVVLLFSAMVLTLVICSPFLIPIVNGVMSGALTQANQGTNVGGQMDWSVPVLSFFLPSLANNFFSSFQNLYSYYSIYAVDPTERVGYLGYTVLLLIFIAIINDARKNNFNTTRTWVVLAVIFTLLSLGPYIQVGALSTPINVNNFLPSIYLLYSHIPILNIIREPGRFILATTICLAILAGLGFKNILEHFENNTKQKRSNYASYLTVLITLLILAEYSGIPFSSSYLNSYFLSLHIPGGYNQIATTPGKFSVMVLPMLVSDSNTLNLYTGMSMYYQTLFKKPIIGGYASRENFSEQYARLNIPLTAQAAWLQSGNLSTYVSPIKENYTNVTLFFLSVYHTKFISVINQAYTPNSLSTLDSYINSTLGSPIYADNTTTIWSTNNTLEKAANSSVVAYLPAGSWIAGCGSLIRYCNSTLNSFWYGSEVREMNIFAPKNNTNLTMLFTADSLYTNTTLSIFLTSNKHPIGATKLTPYSRIYYLNLTLGAGLNSLFFVGQNPATNSSQIYEFGLKNITLKSR